MFYLYLTVNVYIDTLQQTPQFSLGKTTILNLIACCHYQASKFNVPNWSTILQPQSSFNRIWIVTQETLILKLTSEH